MIKPRTKRGLFILGGLASLGIAAYFILQAFNENLVFFYTPTQIANHEAPLNHNFRIGGMVEKGSVQRDPGGLKVEFLVTDTVHQTTVKYAGILPDLFKEGKGVVAQGKINADGVFEANQVLAKHDENYMPPEAGEAIKRAQGNNQKMSKSVIESESK